MYDWFRNSQIDLRAIYNTYEAKQKLDCLHI